MDLKAQKKSINFKKFIDVPLTFEETIAEGIANDRIINESASSQDNFRVRKGKGSQGKRRLNRFKDLAALKTAGGCPESSQSSVTLSTIMTKCDRLKSKVLTDKRLDRFERDAGKCYDYLFELSNFNFQKYEQF